MIPREIASDLGAGHAYVDLVEEYLRTGGGRDAPPPPDLAEVFAEFDEPAPATGRPLDEVLDDVRRRVLPNALWLQDPMHMGHQLSVPLPAAIWAEPLIAALNPSHAVAELSPVTTTIERRVVRWLADLARLGPDAGGTFAIGATEATFSGLARRVPGRCRTPGKTGVRGGEAVVFCSEHAHYSVARAVAQLGIGANNVVRVPSDERRAIDPEALERLLADERRASSRSSPPRVDGRRRVRRPRRDRPDLRGARHLAARRRRARRLGAAVAHPPPPAGRRRAGAVAGVGSAQDDADAAGRERAADGRRGRPRRSLRAERAVPVPRPARGPIDQGVRSFQCSRRADALKVWIAWQRYGTEGFAAVYDHLCATTHAIWERVVEHPSFEPMHEPECNILCFRHVGDDDLNARLRPAYNATGEGWITLTRLEDQPVLRITVMNPRTTDDGRRAHARRRCPPCGQP